MSAQDGRSDASAPANAGGGNLRPIVQVAGFLIALGMLAWAGKLAVSGIGPEQIEHLRASAWYEVLGLVALGVATVVINGLIFALVIRPARRVPVLDVVSVNAIASLLAYLPFKLSLIFRTLVHNRRDGVPLLTIGAWLGAVGVLLMAVYGPMILVSGIVQTVGGFWLIACGLGVLGGTLLITVLARAGAGDAGLSRIERITRTLAGRRMARLVRSDAFARLHAGLDMLASWLVAGGNLLLRAMDLLVHAGRFMLASSMLGAGLSIEEALLLGLVYSFLNAASPTGSLGIADLGTVGVAAWMGLGDGDPARFAGIALLVRASEVIAYLLSTALGVLWLGPVALVRLETRGGVAGAIGSSDADLPAPVEPDDRRDRGERGTD